ncbi:uncharacterized protein LOC117652220 [Thrips palmi]|uniref:Uncharacterized protein LOC117652220 n=1 Tax=Thrips palmi TaxID=161013 RepID=A0A6P9A9I6_THRPL|nr:uncharacterized protein LOC117652220 [Thrips palmi]
MERPKEKDCIGPTAEEVAKCSRIEVVPEPPVRHFRRCVRPNQVAGDAVDRRFVDTKWILNSDGPAAEDHFLTTHQHFFAKPGTCPQPLSRRARLLWHYLLHRHGLKVSQEALAPPEVEPYVTEYTGQYARDDFTPALEADLRRADQPVSEVDARHPLYEDPAVSYWYQKQMLPPRGACWDGVTAREAHDVAQPFRRNALFTTPVDVALHEPPLTGIYWFKKSS